MNLPGVESAPVSGRDAPRWIVSGTLTAAAPPPEAAGAPPVPPPPHAAMTKAAMTATATERLMFTLPPECSWTRELCAPCRLSLWTFAPVKSAVRPDPPDGRPPTVRADDPHVGAPGEEPAERAGRAEGHQPHGRSARAGRREAEERAAV